MNNFSIGEMSKLHNISIQTLRYYDRIGLLKPKVINERSKYRYYSIEQFLQVDVIKYCKSIGLSLEETKKLMENNYSIEGMFKLITTQQVAVEKKLEEMRQIKYHLDYLKSQLSSVIKCEKGKVFVKHNKERRYASYNCISKNIEELEMNYRKVILDIEENRERLNYNLASIVTYNSEKNSTEYKNIMLDVTEESFKHKENVIVFPEGYYVTVYFEGKNFENVEYYKKILDYVHKNNVKVTGDFNEIYILPQVDEGGRERSLMQLEILKV